MTTLYSDRYLPKVGELSNNLRNFDRDRMLLFDEKKVFDMLIREGLFGQYSNSFLVMTGPMTDIVYSRFSNDRAEHLSIRTDILEKDGKHTVRKYLATSAAAAHIEALAENECVFTERFKGSTLSVNRLELKRNPDGLPFAEIEYLEITGHWKSCWMSAYRTMTKPVLISCLTVTAKSQRGKRRGRSRIMT